MKNKRLTATLKKNMGLMMILLAGYLSVPAQSVLDEERGVNEPPPANPPVRNPAARARAMQLLGATGLLLIPESTNDRVMAFDPTTGDLVDPDFIPADPDNLSTPICAIRGFDPDMILVSDQLDDVVQAYDTDGNYLGVFAPAGGPNTAILDNIRGIAMSDNNTLLVTVGGGANDDAVAEFDANGNHLGNLVANGAGGLNSPFDILLRDADSDYLVGAISSDAVHRYDLAGNYIADLTAINTFPEQINTAANGNILVANFSGSEEGIVEYTATGTLVGIYDAASLGGYRGAYELPNGNILTTNGGGVHELDRNGNLVETKISGVSARFIELLGPGIVCENISIQVDIGGPIVVTGNPGCRFDLFNTNCSDDPNDWILLIADIEIGDTGVVVIPGITGQPDTCYLATTTGTTDPLNAQVRTVPTLGMYALIAFAVVLLAAGVLTMRRKHIV